MARLLTIVNQQEQNRVAARIVRESFNSSGFELLN